MNYKSPKINMLYVPNHGYSRLEILESYIDKYGYAYASKWDYIASFNFLSKRNLIAIKTTFLGKDVYIIKRMSIIKGRDKNDIN